MNFLALQVLDGLDLDGFGVAKLPDARRHELSFGHPRTTQPPLSCDDFIPVNIRGRTSNGSKTPWDRMLAASSSRPRASKRRRGFVGDACSWATGRSRYSSAITSALWTLEFTPIGYGWKECEGIRFAPSRGKSLESLGELRAFNQRIQKDGGVRQKGVGKAQEEAKSKEWECLTGGWRWAGRSTQCEAYAVLLMAPRNEACMQPISCLVSSGSR